MKAQPTYSSPAYGSHAETKRSPVRVGKLLRMIFIGGPHQLLTSEISVKCAALMVLMCLPALLMCSILTIPGAVFDSPHQQGYYYFSRVLNDDPQRWVALTLAGLCLLVALAMPAAMPGKRSSEL